MNVQQQVFQCYASEPMEEHFAENLRKRWNLTKYHDPQAPTVMFGWYDHNEDDKFLLNHKGPIIMVWGGADMNPGRAQWLQNRPETYQYGYGWQSRLFNEWGIKHKTFTLPLKDYSEFKPTPLGDKIYVYKGWRIDRGHYFKWDEFIQPLINLWGEDRFVHGMGYDMNYIHENFYNNCFVYIKPNERGGSTGMWELAHMGRKTIAQNQGGAPNVLEFTTLDNIKELVEKEAEKIGTVQNEVAIDTNLYFMHDYRWLNLDWWKQ